MQKISIQKETDKNLKYYLKKFWNFFWKDDSIWGWIFSLVIIVVFIKLIFFPFLNLVTGTALPLAIVESCSMYHDGNLLSNTNVWFENNKDKYETYSITKNDFADYSFKKGFNKGDILFVLGASPKKLKVGDVIIFQANQANPVIHRIVEINTDSNGKRTFSTLGDNNPRQHQFEMSITEEQIVGKSVIRFVPYAGWGKLIFFELRKDPSQRGFCS